MDQSQLRKLNEQICKNPDRLFNKLGLEFNAYNNKISSSCVVHNGDNDHAMQINLETGYWKCYTRGCHEVFKSSLIGFTRGVLSNHGCNWRDRYDKTISFSDTLKFLGSIYNINSIHADTDEEIEKNKFINNIVVQEKKQSFVYSKQQYYSVVKKSEYFISRGFTEKVLQKFDVGSYVWDGRFFSGRSLVPTFDVDYRKILGISGRSEIDAKPKWLHSKGFPSSSTLYGLWHAKEFLRSNRSIILVEGPCDVWRLWEAGIYNAVGLNGCELTPAKHVLLDRLGVMNITLALDNDDAGKKHMDLIQEKWSRFYNIDRVDLPDGVKDFGELSPENIRKVIK